MWISFCFYSCLHVFLLNVIKFCAASETYISVKSTMHFYFLHLINCLDLGLLDYFSKSMLFENHGKVLKY